VIGFGRNHIIDVGLKTLVEAVGEFKNLERIDLSENKITCED
jgi:hypothetical protein